MISAADIAIDAALTCPAPSSCEMLHACRNGWATATTPLRLRRVRRTLKHQQRLWQRWRASDLWLRCLMVDMFR